MKKIFFAILFLSFKVVLLAQFAPPAGQSGTTAIFKDSSVFVRWATNCTVVRGFQDISNPAFGFASAGDSSMATGKSGSNGVVSLGDGGYAIVTFAYPLRDAPGWDFAVFENSFDQFLELAFVEASSDGINFFRFPCTSNTQDTTQILGFGSVDATKIDNLAGKYIAFYGTPFDLQQLANQSGLNINAITHIKITDVVGSIQSAYARHDQHGHKINEPWSTPFATGGFDLDAVGVIHDEKSGIEAISENNTFEIYPNPASKQITILVNTKERSDIKMVIKDITGKEIKAIEYTDKTGNIGITIRTDEFNSGIYFVIISTEKYTAMRKLIISNY